MLKSKSIISIPLNNLISKSIEKTNFPKVKYIRNEHYKSKYILAEDFYKPITRFLIIK